jgi:hypothetical protein
VDGLPIILEIVAYENLWIQHSLFGLEDGDATPKGLHQLMEIISTVPNNGETEATLSCKKSPLVVDIERRL